MCGLLTMSSPPQYLTVSKVCDIMSLQHVTLHITMDTGWVPGCVEYEVSATTSHVSLWREAWPARLGVGDIMCNGLWQTGCGHI